MGTPNEADEESDAKEIVRSFARAIQAPGGVRAIGGLLEPKHLHAHRG